MKRRESIGINRYLWIGYVYRRSVAAMVLSMELSDSHTILNREESISSKKKGREERVEERKRIEVRERASKSFPKDRLSRNPTKNNSSILITVKLMRGSVMQVKQDLDSKWSKLVSKIDRSTVCI